MAHQHRAWAVVGGSLANPAGAPAAAYRVCRPGAAKSAQCRPRVEILRAGGWVMNRAGGWVMNRAYEKAVDFRACPPGAGGWVMNRAGGWGTNRAGEDAGWDPEAQEELGADSGASAGPAGRAADLARQTGGKAAGFRACPPAVAWRAEGCPICPPEVDETVVARNRWVTSQLDG